MKHRFTEAPSSSEPGPRTRWIKRDGTSVSCSKTGQELPGGKRRKRVLVREQPGVCGGELLVLALPKAG